MGARILSFGLLVSLIFGVGSCTSMRGGSARANLLSTGLVGWQQIGGESGSWKCAEGVLYTDGAGGGWLSTVREYEDFVLSLEFRVAAGGNSGVFVRAPHEGDPAYQGMEIQILDDAAERYAHLRPDQYTGGIYDVQAPSERASKPAGQWQKMVVACSGSLVKVVLNGTRVIDTNADFYPYKFERHPGLQRRGGYIGLQNHGSRIEFRNIQIELLSGR
ncbi:MAG: DUF1080 domain-containing protein [Sedimentisphaerales bacterium]|nr:DUF1080 domain-containing protein [Sedimentisphaerales bacterium]